MDRQPPSSFPEPFGTPGSSSNRISQNAAGNIAYHQAYPPPGNIPPPPRMPSPGVYASQSYSSSQLSHPPGRQFTQPNVYTYEHTSPIPHHPAAAPLSGSVSHYPSYSAAGYTSTNPSGPLPPMMQRAVTMPMPVPQITTPSMPYDTSHSSRVHPPSHAEMSRGPQITSRSWGHSDVSEGEGRAPEQSPEGMSDMRMKSPRNNPFAGRRRSSGNGPSNTLPCRHCRMMFPREAIEHWVGFCNNDHRLRWWEQAPNPLPCRFCGMWYAREVVERWVGFCGDDHRLRWWAAQAPTANRLTCGFCERWYPREVVQRWGGFCSCKHWLHWVESQRQR